MAETDIHEARRQAIRDFLAAHPELKETGATIADIAKGIGISRQRGHQQPVKSNIEQVLDEEGVRLLKGIEAKIRGFKLGNSISHIRRYQNIEDRLEAYRESDLTSLEIARRIGVSDATLRNHGIRKQGTPAENARRRESGIQLGKSTKGSKHTPEHVAARVESAKETRRKGREMGKRYGRRPKTTS